MDEDDDTNAAPAKPTQLAQLDALLARLPTLGNRDLIDAAAVEFCYINSKAARKRLVKVIFYSSFTVLPNRLFMKDHLGLAKCTTTACRSLALLCSIYCHFEPLLY